MVPAPWLYYITDRSALDPKPLLLIIEEATRAGVDVIQIREKDLETRQLIELVGTTLRAAQRTATRIVLNDRLDIALGLGAAGIHLGGRSLAPEVVRRHVPVGFLVGVSCHSVQDTVKAETSGADYVLLGPVFATGSKLSYGPPLGVEAICEAASRVRIPILALGGMTPERAREALEAGAAGIAGISIFQNSDSIADLVRRLRPEAS